MSAAVDLVIPNLDGDVAAAACLEGVAAQTLAPVRVIVVDSGSTDGSRAIAEAHGAEWHSMPANKGFAAAVNHGIAISDSPYVALLNNDAVPEPGWLAALVAALESDHDVSFAASRMLLTRGRGMNAAGDSFDVRGRGGYNRGIREPDGPRFDEPRIVFGACAGAAIYRRSLFHDIGLFDEQFFLSWEDIDLDLRAALAGHSCLYVPSAVVHHAQGASSGDWRRRPGAPQQGDPGTQGSAAPAAGAVPHAAARARGVRDARRARGRARLRAAARAVCDRGSALPAAARRGAAAHRAARAVAAAHARVAAV